MLMLTQKLKTQQLLSDGQHSLQLERLLFLSDSATEVFWHYGALQIGLLLLLLLLFIPERNGLSQFIEGTCPRISLP